MASLTCHQTVLGFKPGFRHAGRALAQSDFRLIRADKR